MSSISSTPFNSNYIYNTNSVQSTLPQKDWTPSTEAVKDEFKNMDIVNDLYFQTL